MKLPKPIPDASNGRVSSGDHFQGRYFIACEGCEIRGIFSTMSDAREWVKAQGGGMQIQEMRWIRALTDCEWVPPTKEAVKGNYQP